MYEMLSDSALIDAAKVALFKAEDAPKVPLGTSGSWSRWSAELAEIQKEIKRRGLTFTANH